MTNGKLERLLESLRDTDQDLRAMATSDLLELLKQPGTSLSKEEGDKCVAAFVKLLYDAQSHVQNLAMECLGQAIRLVGAETTESAVHKICKEIQQRGSTADSCALSVALRVMTGRIAENAESTKLLGSLAAPVVGLLEDMPGLASDVTVDALSALAEIVTHAGAHIATDAEEAKRIQGLLLSFVGSSNVAVRRRAISALGAFVVYVPGKHSEEALDTIFQRYEECTRPTEKCILLRVLVTIARQRPERVRKLAGPIVEREIAAIEDSEGEHRITLLLVLEAFVSCCADLVASRRDEIYQIAVDALTFDPNYNYDDIDDGMDTGSEMGDEYDDEFEEDIYEDDGDDSWNVRLGGVKLLAAMAKSGLYTPQDVVEVIGTVLVEAFREREDVVRAEVLLTYATIVDELEKPADSSDSGAVDALELQTPKAIEAILKAIKNYPKSTETKQLALAICTRLVAVSEGILDSSLQSITPLVTSALEAEDTSGTLQTASTSLIKTNLKLDVLEFLRVFAARSSATDTVGQFLCAAKDGIKASVESKTFQVPAAAFEAALSLVRLLSMATHEGSKDIAEFVPWAEGMGQCAVSLTGVSDPALRTSTYTFISELLKRLGDRISEPVVDSLLDSLVELKSGPSCAPVVLGAFVYAATQPTAVPAAKIASKAPEILERIGPLFEQSMASIYTAALSVVVALASYGPGTLASSGDRILQSTVAIISRSAESPPVVALQALAAVFPSVSEDSVRSISKTLLKQLSETTVYDGPSDKALDGLFQAAGRTFPGLVDTWKSIMIENWEQGYSSYAQQRKAASNEAIQVQLPTTTLANAAKGINALYTGFYQAQGSQWSAEFLEPFVAKAPKSTSEVALACLGLRALGYAAERDALGQSEGIVERLNEHIESKNDDVRGEAATALGRYAGNNADMFPGLFRGATEGEGPGASSKLQAVKVAADLVVGSRQDEGRAREMWGHITDYVQGATGALPDVLAQTLAAFAIAFPEPYVGQLAERIAASTTTSTKAFYITAYRTMLADKQAGSGCDEQIKATLGSVVGALDDEDVEIRRVGLLALLAIIQGRAGLIADVVGRFEAALFRQTQVDDALVRVVNMGPFKKRIDDGLEARKSAYHCVHALVRALPGAVDARAVADSVVRGIVDEQDICTVALHTVQVSPAAMAPAYGERLDDVAAAIQTVQERKLGKKAVKQEMERHSRMLRTSVALLVAFEPIAKATPSAAFEALRSSTAESTTELSAFYQELTSG
ncbi:hypothetical protein GGF46_002753 [Coemansia sp. RSA 552]|nr:hypothetical protein GGF46_002753 [Coemansia sp. RSA 552]